MSCVPVFVLSRDYKVFEVLQDIFFFQFFKLNYYNFIFLKLRKKILRMTRGTATYFLLIREDETSNGGA